MQEFLQYLKENNKYDETIPKLVGYCDEITKQEIVKEKPELLKNLSENEQIKSFTQSPWNFQYLSPELQIKYMETDSKYINGASMEAQTKFVEKNAHNITKLNKESQFQLVSENPKLFEYLTKKTQVEYQIDNFEKLDDKQLVEVSLYSGKMGAIGKLSTEENMLHGAGGEKTLLTDGYTYEQFQKFQKLNSSQIANLIQIDANYILPYIRKKG